MIVMFEKRHEHAECPSYATEGSAGADLKSCEAVIVPAWKTARVRTGLAMQIPFGYEGQVRPRSGMSSGGIVAGFGTVDSDYRGEVSVVIHNLSDREHEVKIGDKIAQMVIAQAPQHQWRLASAPLSNTKRGENGFGSSGA